MSNRWFDTLGVFDLETTGIDVSTARIVQAHVGVLGADGSVLERREWLADPGVEIPAGASAVHGITTEQARMHGRPAALVVAEIVEALSELIGRGLAITIYNAPYDLTLLKYEALRHGVTPLHLPAPIIDPLVLDKAMDRYRPGKRTLTAACEHYGVELVGAHDAGADAVAAGRVAQAMVRVHGSRLPLDLEELHRRQITWCAEHAASFEDWMRRTKDPTFTTSGEWPVRAASVAAAVL